MQVESFTNCFQTLFASTCRPAVTARLWDMIFLHGWPFVHSVALALFAANEQMLLQETSMERVMPLLSTLGETIGRPEQLIAEALNRRVRSKELTALSKKFDQIEKKNDEADFDIDNIQY